MPTLKLLTVLLATVLWVADCIPRDTAERRSRRYASSAKCGVRTRLQGQIGDVEDYPQLNNETAEAQVIGGVTAEVKWPWMARLIHRGKHVCGGTVIDHSHVVTAAHCFTETTKDAKQWTVMVGELKHSGGHSSFYKVDELKVHEEYSGMPDMYHDIAVLRLKINLPAHTMPVCMPARDDLKEGDNLSILGWGRLSKGGRASKDLQEIHDVELMTNEKCQDIIKTLNHHQKNLMDFQFCSGNAAGGKGACEGDSGGPVMFHNYQGQYEFVGVVSYGYQCGMPKISGVYTKVYSHLEWIKRFLEEGELTGRDMGRFLNEHEGIDEDDLVEEEEGQLEMIDVDGGKFDSSQENENEGDAGNVKMGEGGNEDEKKAEEGDG